MSKLVKQTNQNRQQHKGQGVCGKLSAIYSAELVY